MSEAANKIERRPPDWGRLGLGTGTLASLGRAASRSEVRLLLDTLEGLDIGVIDTADSYGSGDCERLLSGALRGRRDNFRIITKAGYRYGNLPVSLPAVNQVVKKLLHRFGSRQCFDLSYLSNCLDESLKRLKTDHVEAFLLHDPPASVVGSPEMIAFFDRIKSQGKSMLVGVSSSDNEVIRVAIACGWCEVIENPANLQVAHDAAPLWQSCLEQGIHLAGNYIYKAECLRFPGMSHELLMRASAALLPPGGTLLCGTRNPEHIRMAQKWALDPLPVEEALHICTRMTMASAPAREHAINSTRKSP